jgi:hypothetical protein
MQVLVVWVDFKFCGALMQSYICGEEFETSTCTEPASFVLKHSRISQVCAETESRLLLRISCLESNVYNVQVLCVSLLSLNCEGIMVGCT